MFELLAFVVALAVAGLVIMTTVALVKFVVGLIVLPFKLIFFPIAILLAIVKFTFLLVAGVTFIALAAAVLIPMVILGCLIALPIVFFAAAS